MDTRYDIAARLAFTALFALEAGSTPIDARPLAESDAKFGTFVGSTPCGEPVRQPLRINANARCEIIEWKLTLYQSPQSQAASRYELHARYGLGSPGKPGVAKSIKTLERRGTWITTRGVSSNPQAVVYELDGAVELVQADANVLHILNSDRGLMAGNTGWSYTLNRKERAEARVDPARSRSQPEMSYRLLPLSAGPDVFAVFGGRSPCQGIARQLQVAVDAGCSKLKGRLTLFQNPETKAPTTYALEGSLYGQGAREGTWSVTRGTRTDPDATVYQLSPTNSEPAALLLEGDENVLFFLDEQRSLLVGHSEFSYTLDRWPASEAR